MDKPTKNMKRTPDTWIADGYDVKQRGGRMIAYCGPHHTPPHQYPPSCRLQDEENARWIAAAPTCIADLERERDQLKNNLKLARLAAEEVLDWGLTAPTHWSDCDKSRFAEDVARCRRFFNGLKPNTPDQTRRDENK
jgi:hypothetical protein